MFHLVALDDAVPQVDLRRVPAHLDRRGGQRHAVHFLRGSVRDCGGGQLISQFEQLLLISFGGQRWIAHSFDCPI